MADLLFLELACSDALMSLATKLANLHKVEVSRNVGKTFDFSLFAEMGKIRVFNLQRHKCLHFSKLVVRLLDFILSA